MLYEMVCGPPDRLGGEICNDTRIRVVARRHETLLRGPRNNCAGVEKHIVDNDAAYPLRKLQLLQLWRWVEERPVRRRQR